jgi:hypothetical protein
VASCMGIVAEKRRLAVFTGRGGAIVLNVYVGEEGFDAQHGGAVWWRLLTIEYEQRSLVASLCRDDNERRKNKSSETYSRALLADFLFQFALQEVFYQRFQHVL